MWETELILPPDNIKDGIAHPHAIAGPNGTLLLAIERTLTVGPDAGGVDIRVAVAVDRRDSDAANAGFRDVLIKSLAVLGLALLGASLLQVQIGLRPLDRLRTALQSVHGGQAENVAGDFPIEVQPLVADMNALLERERNNNRRARERAADLAHGFKTPLAVLSTVSRELQRGGRLASAAEIDTQINIMGRHVKRELARARTVGAAAVSLSIVPVRPILEKIVVALQRISADRSLTWKIDAGNDAIFFGDENDLLELVGNLAENAAKWATSHVLIRAETSAGGLTLVVEDDGPGVPEKAHAEILVRGHRLDETADGSGLGLSIVARIVHAYSGTLHIGQSSAGGLKVTVTFAGDHAS